MKSGKEQEANVLSQEMVDRGFVPSHFTSALFVDGCNQDDASNAYNNDKEKLQKEQGGVHTS